jgi:hypothetical protein
MRDGLDLPHIGKISGRTSTRSNPAPSGCGATDGFSSPEAEPGAFNRMQHFGNQPTPTGYFRMQAVISHP